MSFKKFHEISRVKQFEEIRFEDSGFPLLQLLALAMSGMLQPGVPTSLGWSRSP